MGSAALAALVEDIRKQGLLEPIITWHGMILDGRNRWRACGIAGVDPMTAEWSGSDPLAYIISKNLYRRHLDMSQRAMVAGRLQNMKLGDNKGITRPEHLGSKDFDTPEVSAQQAADMMSVTRPHVFHAKTILEHGTPEEIAACDAGTMRVSTLATAIRRRRRAASEVEPKDQTTAQESAVVIRLHPPGRGKAGAHPGVKLPPGETAEGIARRAVALRERLPSVAAVAKELGIAAQACAQMIDITLIANRTDLSVRETAMAAAAFQKMSVNAEPLTSVHQTIQPIALRLWGSGQGSHTRQATEATRVDRFDRTVGILITACANAARIDVPQLSAVKATETLEELNQAIRDVKALIQKIGEIRK